MQKIYDFLKTSLNYDFEKYLKNTTLVQKMSLKKIIPKIKRKIQN